MTTHITIWRQWVREGVWHPDATPHASLDEAIDEVAAHLADAGHDADFIGIMRISGHAENREAVVTAALDTVAEARAQAADERRHALSWRG